MLAGKTIILGVSSSIAAYKACEIVSRLKKLGADVWVVMTRSATQLITPQTFRTLSCNPVLVDLFAPEFSAMPVPHIALAKMADLLIIAPATANVIGKLAHGIGDDALTTLALSITAPKLIAPAMNCEMWRNPIVRKNVSAIGGSASGGKKLKELKWRIIGPEAGHLACGDDDIGRMSEPEEIIEATIKLFAEKFDLEGKNILITAGGTREAIDPVRYISNRSSGKMGYALARAARARGAKVTLVSGPTYLPVPADVEMIKVESAAEMMEAVLAKQKDADAIVMAAAVGDFTRNDELPITNDEIKLKKIKRNNNKLSLTLKSTQDILQIIAQQKDRKNKILVGFALETDDLIKNAKAKLKAKDLDLIVANEPATFDSDEIKFSLINRAGKIDNLPKQTKTTAANLILDRVQAML
ncbi:bifunctional phosphopantothenoylcysteine decarboxylase/phosphopantothenate--cysteine ligase CoaBC [Candidatus Saganbacteria bacterium]|nr:bifunctional phosphopantothenoylcysteine decarboxylase/phosphopantothenate--cysteine ligase CoaBC [Candidatus Saganbacteria bacterium]